MVLSHLLYALDYNPILAHCNFQLREEESDDDAKFVSKFANRLGLVHHEKSFDTNSYASKQKCAIQEAARELRYHWFNELLSNHNYDFLMTAHHSDDNLETFFINFLRGTGLDGLTGIPEVNGTTIRPVLPFSKSDLASYAKQNGISWREDCSNKSDKYVRNKLRNEIIPILKEMNTGILHTFNQTIDHLKESRAIIDEHMIQLKEQIVHTENGETKISIKGLSLMKDPSIYLYELLKEYGFNAWKDIKNLLNAQSGKVIFSHSHQLLKDRAYLVLTSLKDTGKMSHVMPELGEYEFDDLQITVSNGKPDFSGKEKGIAFVDKDEIEFPLYLRKWKNGDYFYP
ncbi:UNVERIFIED_CONTAM: hypothetical protein GTU68_046847, partial [Idotea baltica]|nr:hypothetical protein [Idotea baltica]